MLKDLQSSFKLEEMSLSQIIGLLGEPDYKDDSSMAYKVEQKFGSDIDPVFTKTFEVQVSDDKRVKAVGVREWKK